VEFIDILISIVLALVMFGIGATLNFRDFRRTFVIPRALLLGLVLQMIFLPVLAFFLARFSGLDPTWQVGFFLIAICPGGSTSNFISYIVNADVALSIALTSVNSILILVTIPLLTNFAAGYFIEEAEVSRIHIGSTFIQIFFILFLPVLLGIAVNYWNRSLIQKSKKPLKIINVILLGLVFGIKFFAPETEGGSGITTEDIIQILPSTLWLHSIALMVSYLVALKVLDKFMQATTISIEVGLQNTTLALLIAGTILEQNEMTKPALVYALFSFFTTLVFALITTRFGRQIGRFMRIGKK
jgi:BASS family bile acid:Na+ symporter